MNTVQLASELTLYMVLAVAVVQDLQFMRISNRLIVAGLALSVMFKITLGQTSQILHIVGNMFFPVIVLYLLYLLGVLGAGDIKLFSVIGGFTNFKTLTDCMVTAFVVGAVLSVIKMLRNRNFGGSMQRAHFYLQGLLLGKCSSYRKLRTEENLIHFSVAILAGLLIVRLGEV